MVNQSKTITAIAICGVAMLILLISQYKNLAAQSDVEDKANPKLAYQSKGEKIPDWKRGNDEKQKAGKDNAPYSENRTANLAKESKGDTDFYRVVVENNLFRPLGWQRPNREPQYTLIGTMIETDSKIAKAFLMERRSNQFYAVSIGEKVGDAIVKDIQSNQVTLYKAGEMMTLHAESFQFLSGVDGRGGGSQSSNGENRPDQNPGTRDGKQPNSDQMKNRNEMKNRAQNTSREERLRVLGDQLKAAVAAGKLSEEDAMAKYKAAGGDKAEKDGDDKGKVEYDKDDDEK